MKPYFTAVIQKEDDMYVSLCPEFDIASQGYTVEEAKNNLREALELFLDTASQYEIEQRLNRDIYISALEVDFAKV